MEKCAAYHRALPCPERMGNEFSHYTGHLPQKQSTAPTVPPIQNNPPQ